MEWNSIIMEDTTDGHNLKRIEMTRSRNIKFGIEKLRVLNDAVSLYTATCMAYSQPNSELKKVAMEAIDASRNIFSNISEGYGRTGGNDYLRYLNRALASAVVLHSCLSSSLEDRQITAAQFKAVDQILDRTESQLIQLIEFLQGLEKRKKPTSMVERQIRRYSPSPTLVPKLSY